jgi:predicted Zn finger-like uncharacterized protein
MAVSVQCPHCQAKLSLKSDSALGKKVACPKCKTPFQAKAAEEDPMDFLDELDPEDDSPPPEEEETPEEPERPARRSSGSKKGKASRRKSVNVLPYILGGTGLVLVLALVAGLGFLVFQMLGARRGLDLSWIPADAEFVGHLKVNEFRESEFAKTIMDAQAVELFDKTLVENTGTRYADIQTITLGGNRPNMPSALGMTPMSGISPPRGSLVIRSTAPFDQAGIRSRLKMAEAQHAGKTYARSEGTTKGALYFPEPTTLVLADESVLQTLLATDGRTDLNPDMSLVNTSAQFFLVSTGRGPQMIDAPPGIDRTKVSGSGIDIVTRSDLTLNVRWRCTDAATSESLRSFYETQINQGRETMKILATFNPIMASLDDILAKIKTQSTATDGMLTVTVPASIKQTIQTAMNSMGQPAGGMPFGDGLPVIPTAEEIPFDASQFPPAELPATEPAVPVSNAP